MLLPREVHLERIPAIVPQSGFLKAERRDYSPGSQDLGGRIVEMYRVTQRVMRLFPVDVDELAVRQEATEPDSTTGLSFSTYYRLGPYPFTPISIITTGESDPYGLPERVALLSVHLQDPQFQVEQT